jgi:rubrerythrin
MQDNPTIRDAVEFAATTEEMGEWVYTRLSEKFSDHSEVSKTFSLLASDEKAHGAKFKGMLEGLSPRESVMTSDENKRYLSAMAMSRYFRGEEGLVDTLESIRSVEEALIHVFGFEKATLGFYVAVRESFGKSEVLDAIIHAEKSHLDRLMKYILTSEKMKGLANNW